MNMKKSTVKWMSLLAMVVLCLASTAVIQSQNKPLAEPVGEILSSGGNVSVNGTQVTRGSTVFNKNEIQTGTTTAFVNFSSGGGVLSIAPDSRVKVSREQGKIIAEVLQGSVTLRSPLASTIIAPDRVVSSDPDNLYTVSVSDASTTVQALMKPLSVTMNGVVNTIAVEAAQTMTTAAFSKSADKPEPHSPAQNTPRPNNCFVDARCRVTMDNFVTVTGAVSCGGVPVPDTRVRLDFVFLDRFRPRAGPFTTTTGADGHYSFVKVVPAGTGGVAIVQLLGNCGACSRGTGNSNRCNF
jgi:hypothetical protein